MNNEPRKYNRGQIAFTAIFTTAGFVASVLGAYYVNNSSIDSAIHQVDLKLSDHASIDTRQDEAIGTIKSELKEIKDLQIQILKEIRY